MSYQEMGLDRGMELSTLGKVFISPNPDLKPTLFLCCYLLREVMTIWEVIYMYIK